MRDILPEQARQWRDVESKLVKVLLGYAYEEVQLPLLEATDMLPLPTDEREWLEWQKVWRCPPGPERGKIRSRFFEGIGKAMADQWSW